MTTNDSATPAFRVEALLPSQVRMLYTERLIFDFPPDEVKPLSSIERALARGEYLCLGGVSGDEILAYAFFVRLRRASGACALLDYFAVADGLRDRGIGSAFLRAVVRDRLGGALPLLVEVEDPDRAKDAAALRLRKRRLRFYRNNGLKLTGVAARMYGADYRLLVLPGESPVSDAEVRRLYAALYRAMLPEEAFLRQIIIE